MSVSTVGRSRIELSATSAALAVGDVAAILLFVAVGEYTHGYNPFVAVGRVAGTLAPFLIGWVLVAGVAGMYASDATGDLKRSLSVTIVSWVLAVVVAQALRATAYFHGDAALTFAVVSVGIGGALLCLWRASATVLLSS
ncbi:MULTISPECIES: DUF3054 domain-containing protein [Haloarcula]|nr:MULTISPECIES: DUF3054 domain-containing protein [Halomicroarcula]MBX0347087.1 DUF3054 domain-containing protein [Halomicroarcula pellucida]MDS0277038.1 DUF3054 domain-containing protein [Halomicroarcula sp. S1AR25-4]